jgi:hypothetical protein
MTKKKAAAAAELTTIEKVKADERIGDDAAALRDYSLKWANLAQEARQVAKDSIAGWTGSNEQVKRLIGICESRGLHKANAQIPSS